MALSKLGVPHSLIEIIRAFHHEMKATIRLDNTSLEEFEVHNGLRQGCCIAPVLFNLYACLVAERWTARMEGIEGVGVHLHHKTDGKLFRRYTRNACESYLTECQFADDTALLATTREGAEKALKGYMKVAQDFGLTVSIAKTKVMASGQLVVPNDEGPIVCDDSSCIEAVQEFQYLGSIVERHGRVDSEVWRRVMQGIESFWLST